MSPEDAIYTLILPKLDCIRKTGNTYQARCPAHDDRNPSLSVSPGKTQPVVLHCHAGCTPDQVLAALGLNWDDLCGEDKPKPDKADLWIPCGWDRDTKTYNPAHQKTAEYLYHDPDGVLVFGVARCALKNQGCGFRQWRPDPTKKNNRSWSRRMPNGEVCGEELIYRLPEVLRATSRKPFPATVWVVEGEKDADRLWASGYVATCNAGGAGKWTPEHAQWLAGADVVVLADRDEPGWAHAKQVAQTLQPVAATVELRCAADPEQVDLGLPGAAVRIRRATRWARLHGGRIKDLSDHLDAGMCMEDLRSIREIPTHAHTPALAHQ